MQNIWPEIGRLRDANGVRIAKSQERQLIEVKKAAIDSMGQQIASGDEEKTIKEYLPENKVEERIISNLNYLAADANVSLNNLSLTTGNKNSSAIAPVAANGMATILNPIANADAASNNQKSIENGAKSGDTMQSLTASISVSGDYDKIKIFLDGIDSLPMLSTTKTLNIIKQPATQKDGVSVSSNVLVANIGVEFDYMSIVKVDSQKASSFKSDIDTELVDVLKKYVSRKVQNVDSGNGSSENGRSNPFLAN